MRNTHMKMTTKSQLRAAERGPLIKMIIRAETQRESGTEERNTLTPLTRTEKREAKKEPSIAIETKPYS